MELITQCVPSYTLVIKDVQWRAKIDWDVIVGPDMSSTIQSVLQCYYADGDFLCEWNIPSVCKIQVARFSMSMNIQLL